MGREKLRRFEENLANPLIVEPGKEIYENVKGAWVPKVLKKEAPLVLEIGCGKGEYTVGLARIHPEKNFIGVDIKGARLWKGGTIAKEEGLGNVAFLRSKVELLENFFNKEDADEIWITFPDPRPRDRDEKRRLTSPRFLDVYRSILRTGGIVHLKTDNDGLFEFTREVLDDQKIEPNTVTTDLYKNLPADLHFKIQTTYEKKYLEVNKNINYLNFNL